MNTEIFSVPCRALQPVARLLRAYVTRDRVFGDHVVDQRVRVTASSERKCVVFEMGEATRRGVRLTMDAPVAVPWVGELRVPLLRAVASAPALWPVVFALEGGRDDRLVIETGNATYRCTTLFSGASKVLPVSWENDQYEIVMTAPLRALHGALTSAVRSASRDAERSRISSVRLVATAKGLCAVGTDGHRLTVSNRIFEHTVPPDLACELLVPRTSVTAALPHLERALRVARANAEATPPVAVVRHSQKKNAWALTFGSDEAIVGRTISEKYPDFTRVLSEVPRSRTRVDARALERMVRLACAFPSRMGKTDRSKGIALVLSRPGQLVVSRTFCDENDEEIGEFSASVARFGEEELVCRHCFDSQYLFDVVRALRDGDVVIDLGSKKEDTVVFIEREDPGGSDQHVVMGLRDE